MRTKKDKYGYIVLVHDYGIEKNTVTSPTRLHGPRLTVVPGLNAVEKNCELKNRYPIYVKYPNNDVIENIRLSNEILQSQGKLYYNSIHKCIIPKGSNVEKFVGGHMVGEQSELLLSDNVQIS